jgi:Chitin synthase export chaperone
MGVEFGSFNKICETAALVICPLVGTDHGIEPTCYSRNVDVGGTLIFQPCKHFFPWLLSVWGKSTLTIRGHSNMFRAYSGHYHDCHHDLAYTE